MLQKLGYLLIALAVTIFIIIWQLPTIFGYIPSRYIARWVPEPIQQIARRDTVQIVPTAAAIVDTDALLALQPTKTPAPTNTPPPTNTPAVTPDASPTPNIDPVTPTPVPTSTPTPLPLITELPITTRLDGINHQMQSWNNCGPATLAMSLSYFDLNIHQDETALFLKPNVEDRNVNPQEMAEFVNQNTNLQAIERANGNIDQLKQFLANDMPVIVEIGIDPPGEYAWLEWYGHYLLVVAYDNLTETFFVYDSWLGTDETPGTADTDVGRRWTYTEFDHYWSHFNHNYVVLFEEEQRPLAETIIGPNMDDDYMWETALTDNQLALETDRENPFLWFNLGTIFTQLEQYEQAAASFDQARAIGLPRRMLWYQFGAYEAYYEVGRYEDVILLADITLDKPYLEEVLYYRGLAHAALGNQTQARDDLEAAAAFNPRFTAAQEALQTLN
ncbi:MAG TPA: C39 family peptidase [Anaerolineae bacterium]|nr:C39 family peptidase [Anaerolineae bacterium]